MREGRQKNLIYHVTWLLFSASCLENSKVANEWLIKVVLIQLISSKLVWTTIWISYQFSLNHSKSSFMHWINLNSLLQHIFPIKKTTTTLTLKIHYYLYLFWKIHLIFKNRCGHFILHVQGFRFQLLPVILALPRQSIVAASCCKLEVIITLFIFYWTLLLFNDSYHYTMVLLQYLIIVKVYTFVNFVQ